MKIKVTKVLHEFHDLKWGYKNTVSVGEFIDSKIEQALRDGTEIGSVRVDIDPDEWEQIASNAGATVVR